MQLKQDNSKMETKIIKQEKNPLLEREEILIEIKADSTPSAEEVKKIVGKDENLVVVKKINSSFGKRVFTAEVFVYDSVEVKNRIEVKKKRKSEEAEKSEKPKPAEKTEKEENLENKSEKE